MTYRNARLARTAEQMEARRRVKNGAHTLVLVAQGVRSVREVGEVAAKTMSWWEDLRRGRLPVYGSLLRFIDISIALGTPKPVLKQIPQLIDWYIEDRYGPTDTAEIKLVA